MKNNLQIFKLTQDELKLAINDTTSSTLWTGIDAPGFYSKVLFESTAIADFTKILDAKSKVKIAKIDASSIIQEDDDTFSSSTVNLSQKQITVDGKKINLELPIATLEQSFISTSLMPGSNTMATTGDFLNYVMDYSARLAAQDIEVLTWSSSNSQGLMYKASADSATIRVTGTTVTAGNVIAELTKVYNAILPQLLVKPDLRIYVGGSIYKAYRIAFSTAVLSSGVYNGDLSDVSFMGIKLVPSLGIGANQMFVGQLANLFYTTDLVEDYKNLNIVDLWNSIGVPSIRLVARFKFAVDYAKSEEVVYYI